MNVSRRFPAQLSIALTVSALVVVIGAAAALAQGSGGSTGIANGPTTASAPDVAVGTGIAAPAWCCGSDGSVPGLTTVGQATMQRQGSAARDAAIAAAVQDATAQASAAADAAGILLGTIIDLQVSSMPMIYPMVGTTSGSGTAPGGVGGMEPAPATDSYLGSVSVTITWSLG